MIVRALSLAGGLAGAVGLSQLPEFSQQYLQRLAGQVDVLAAEVAAFDADAAAAGLSRGEALTELTGTEFLDARQAHSATLFARYQRLSADLAALRGATPFERALMPQHLADPALLRLTWADYSPAVPTTSAGAVTAGFGWVAGWLAVGGLLTLLLWPLRRRRAGAASRRQPLRVEPAPPAHALPGAPRLPGASRPR